MSAVRYPQRIQSVHVESINGELCVYDTARQRVHSLNHTAAFVWQRCDGRTAPGELAAALSAEASIDDAEAVVQLTLHEAGRRATAGGAARRGRGGVAARPAAARRCGRRHPGDLLNRGADSGGGAVGARRRHSDLRFHRRRRHVRRARRRGKHHDCGQRREWWSRACGGGWVYWRHGRPGRSDDGDRVRDAGRVAHRACR